MATTKDNLLLEDIERNRKKVVMLGDKQIKIRRLVNAVAKRFDRLTAEAEISYKDGELILNMGRNRDLIAKSASLVMLGSWFKVTFFHWIHWRIINAKYSTQELGGVIKEGLDMGEYRDCLDALLCLQDNSSIIKRMATETIRNIMAEQRSAEGAQSSSSSTER